MDKLNYYRECLQSVLEEHRRLSRTALRPQGDEVETQLIVDRENDHYQLLRVGWRNNTEPIFGCSVHASIKNDKIWIERDFTEYGVANELIDRGVPKEDIVLAFHAPYKRPYTGFAVA